MLQKIKERILAGGEITPDEALELAQKAIHSDLYTAADEIRKKFCNKTLDTCSIINARSGHCPENCKWCAQSAHHHTQIETYDAIPIHEAISIARLNEQQGIKIVFGHQREKDKSLGNRLFLRYLSKNGRRNPLTPLRLYGTIETRRIRKTESRRSKTLSLQLRNSLVLFFRAMYHTYH